MSNTPHSGLHFAACFGKQQYADRKSARKIARTLEKRKRERNYTGMHSGMVEEYHCAHCGLWHIGRKKRRAKG
jgi:hypothetical protein